MNEFKIEKDIPLPSPRTEMRSFPFNTMEIGDSILVSGSENVVKCARSAAARYGKSNDRKFTAHICENGLRIWRIK